MTVVVNMEPNSSKLDAALSRISLRFRGLEQEANRVNKSVDKLNNVKLDTSNATSELQKLNTSVTATAKSIENQFSNISNNIQKAFMVLSAVVAGGAITKGILDAADSVTVLENRIAMVTGRNAELSKTKEELYAIAKASKVSVEGTVETFSRFGTALKDSNVSMNDLLKATTSVQKAIAIVGGPAESANAAIFQLGQALSSGTLRGAELNSILEQAPRIARAISDELGVSIGSLRGMAEEGKLTSEVVLGAMLNQSQAINEEFKLVNSTLGQSKTVLKDSFKAVLADFDRGFGMSAGIAENFDLISEALDSLKPNMVTFGFNMRAMLINPVKDFFTIVGGIANILAAVFQRVAAAQFAVILPMRTFADDVSVLYNYVLVGAVTNAINTLLGFRAVLLQPIDAGVAKAFYDLFNADTVAEFRAALDKLAESIRLMGYQWFNVLNFVERATRQTNISLLKTGIYLGIIDQKLIRFRKPSFETFSKSAEVAGYYLQELFTIAIADPANDLWVAAAQVVVQKFARILEGAGNSYRDFMQKITGSKANFGADQIIRLSDAVRSLANSFGSIVIVSMYDSFLASVSYQLKYQLKYMLQQVNVIKMMGVVYNDFLSGIIDLPGQFMRNFPRVISDFSDSLVGNSSYILESTIKKTIKEFPYSSLADLYEDIATSLFISVAGSVSSLFDGLFDLTKLSIFKSLADSFSYLSKNIDSVKESLATFKFEGIYDIYTLLKNDNGIIEYFDRIRSAVKDLSEDTLGDAAKKVMVFVSKVERAFFWLYDKVVGHSWWPDTMEGIVNSAKEQLSKARQIVDSFVNRVENSFKKFYKKPTKGFADNLVNNLKSSFSIGVGYILQGIGGINSAISSVSTEAGRAIGLAVLAGFLKVLAPGQLVPLYNFLFLALITDLTSRIMEFAGKEIFDSNVVGSMFAPLGDQLGAIIREGLLNLPAIIEFAGQISSDFVNAFLENFGLIGDAIIGLKNLVPGSGILDAVIFGGSVSLFMGKFDVFTKAINGFLSVLLGTSIGGIGVDAAGKNSGGILGMLIFGSKARLIIGTIVSIAGVLGTLSGALNTFSPITTMTASLGILGLAIFGGSDFLAILKHTLVKTAALLQSFYKGSETAGIISSLLPNDNGKSIKSWFTNNMPNLSNFFKQDSTGKGVMAIDFIDSMLNPTLFKERLNKMKEIVKNIKWGDLKSGKTANFAASIFGLLDATTFFKDLTGGFERIKTKATGLSKLSSLFGETGFIGKIFFGKFGKIALLAAAIVAIFATASNAATGLEETASTLSSALEFGLIGLAIFGPLGHKGVRSAATSAAKTIAGVLFGTSGVLGNSARTAKTNTIASILNIKQIIPYEMFAKGGGLLGRLLLGAGTGVIGLLGRTIGIIGSVVGAIGGLPALAAAAGVGALGLYLFGPGDGLFDSFNKLWDMTVDWWTGTNKAARNARAELDSLLKFDKVGDITITLKAQLDKVNLGAMNRQDLDGLRGALTTANKIYERNQSVFENEGKLTRSQIREVKLATNNVENTIKKLPGFDEGAGEATAAAVNKNLYQALVDAGVASQQFEGDQRVIPTSGLVWLDAFNNIFEEGIRSYKGVTTGVQPLSEELVASRLASGNAITMSDFTKEFKAIFPKLASDLSAMSDTREYDPAKGFLGPDVRSMVGEFNPKVIQDQQEAAVNLANRLAVAMKDRNLSNKEDVAVIKQMVALESLALDQANARVALAGALVTENEAYLSSLDGLAAKAISIGVEGISGSSDLQGAPQVLVDELERSMGAYEVALNNIKHKIYEDMKKDKNLNVSYEDFLGLSPDLASAFSFEDIKKSMINRGLSEEEALSLLGLSEAVMTAAGNLAGDKMVDALQKKLYGSLDSLNQRLSDAGVDLKLDFLPESEAYGLAEPLLRELESAIKEYNLHPTEINFFRKEKLEEEVKTAFSTMEEKLNTISGLVDGLPDVNSMLLLEPNTLKRIVEYGATILTIMQMIRNGANAGPGALNAPVGGSFRAQAGATLGVSEAQIKKLAGVVEENTDSSAGKGGEGSAKTWWESFKEALSSMNLELDDDILAGIGKQTLDSLIAASNKYKAAQEAINKSAAGEVELRKKNLKIMQDTRREAIASLNDGTFGGVSAMMQNLGQSIDAELLGMLNQADMATAESVSMRIEQLTAERNAMAAGSSEQIAATMEITRLGDSLEKLTSKAADITAATQGLKDSFNEQFKSFLKGEATLTGVFEGILDSFTNTIIDKFSQAFTDNVFKALGLDKFFDNLFSQIFSSISNASGGGAAGALGSGLGSLLGGLFGGGGGGGGFYDMVFAAGGGRIAGPGTGTSDSIMAMLSNGEYVVNAATTKRWLPFLETLNANDGKLPAFAGGGAVGPSNPTAFKVMKENNNKNKQQQVFNINVTGDVSTQARKEIARMIPEITAGVNMTNRERGSR